MLNSQEFTKLNDQITILAKTLKSQNDILKQNIEIQTQLQEDNHLLKERCFQLQQNYNQLQEQLSFLLDFITGFSNTK